MKIIFLLLLFIVCSPILLTAQNVAEQKYRLAESYEKSGDFESAIRLIEEIIIEIQPGQNDYDKYFDAYIRNLRALSRFSEMISPIENYLESQQNEALLSLYGEILWRVGNTTEANKVWERAINQYKDNLQVYLLISQAQIDLRLYDRAINTLDIGRKNLKDQRAFSDPMSRLYIATGNYQKGTDEVLNLLMSNWDLSLAQGRLYALMINDDAIEYIDNKLSTESRKYAENLYFQELHGWFLRNSGNLEKAFEIFKVIDKLKGSEGLEILRFADQSRMDGQYEIALRAYSHIINLGKENRFAPSALYGFTRTLELNLLTKQEMTKNEIDEVINNYRQVIRDYPKSQNDAQARIRIASMYFDYLKDTKKAIEELDSFTELFPNHQLTTTALNMLGNIYLFRNELANAAESYRKVTEQKRNVNQVELDFAKYHLAKLEYYQGNIDTAKVLFQSFTNNSDSEITNDALIKIQLITQNETFIEPLKLYAQADLFIFQNNPQKAIGLLEEVYKKSSGSDLSENALIKSANLNFEMGNYAQARKYVETLLEENPESIYSDYALFIIGDTYFAEKNYEKATEVLSRLLAKYPRSIYLEKARTTILEIRRITS